MEKILEYIDYMLIKYNIRKIKAKKSKIKISCINDPFSYIYKTESSQNISFDKLSTEITTKFNKLDNSKFIINVLISIAIILTRSIKLGLFCVSIILCVFFLNRTKSIIESVQLFEYEIDDSHVQEYTKLIKTFSNMKSKYMWIVLKKPQKVNYEKSGINGQLVLKSEVESCNPIRSKVISSIAPIVFNGYKVKITFLPDLILYQESGVSTILKYSDIYLKSSEINIIEEFVNPSDSETVGETINSRGRGRKWIPIKRYGELVLSSKEKEISIITSNIEFTSELYEALLSYKTFNYS